MDDYCHECKKKTEIIHIHSAGDTVCSECGLVLEAYSIDDTSEWRTFTDSTDDDPNRVGARINPLLEDAELVTHVSNDGAKSENFLSPRRWQNRESSSTRTLMSGFSTIDAMSDRLNLVETIKDRAKEIYKKMEDQKACRGRKQDAVLAACLYIACRQEDKPRTIKEIGSIANGATKKEIGRAKELIVKQLELEMGQTVDPGDFMKRFCSNLGMTNQMVKVAQEAVNKAKEFDIRRSPISIAAAVIYIVTRISNHDKSLKDVTVATGVAETTIRHAFKDLSPYLVKILPSGYAQEKDLNDITIP